MDIEIKSKQVAIYFQEGNLIKLRPLLYDIFNTIKNNPEIINEINDLGLVSRMFYIMLEQKTTTDIDIQQQMSAIGYYIISKAINRTPNNLELIKDRLLIMFIGSEPLMYTINPITIKHEENFNPLSSSFARNVFSRAKEALLLMNIADLTHNPILTSKIELFANWYSEYSQFIENGEIEDVNSIEQAIILGKEYHAKFFDYLHEYIMIDKDLDF